jgi:hypothetical protein
LKFQTGKYTMHFEHKDYSCSNGWLDCFKNRHSIVYAQVRGKVLSAGIKTANEWVKSVWEEHKKGCTEEEIYNANETGLFYNMTIDTFKFNG